jgi:hypothetical protein
MDYTVQKLIDRIKRNAAIPRNQLDFTDSDIIEMINDEMYSQLVPWLMSFNEEFFVDFIDYPVLASQKQYELPTRAIGSTLREVKIWDNADVTVIKNIPKINLELISNVYDGFYLQDNYLMMLRPENYVNKTIRMFYTRRPNYLINTDNIEFGCGQITDITGTTVTLSNLPVIWDDNTTVDVIRGKPQFTQYSMDLPIVVLGTNQITVTLPSVVSVGDWVAMATYSPIPTLPIEITNLLCQMVVTKITEIYAENEAATLQQAKLADMKNSVKTMINPRVVGEEECILNTESTMAKVGSWYTRY